MCVLVSVTFRLGCKCDLPATAFLGDLGGWGFAVRCDFVILAFGGCLLGRLVLYVGFADFWFFGFFIGRLHGVAMI